MVPCIHIGDHTCNSCKQYCVLGSESLSIASEAIIRNIGTERAHYFTWLVMMRLLREGKSCRVSVTTERALATGSHAAVDGLAKPR